MDSQQTGHGLEKNLNVLRYISRNINFQLHFSKEKKSLKTKKGISKNCETTTKVIAYIMEIPEEKKNV